MIKRVLFISTLITFYLNGFAQTNLVLNPSFEDTVDCSLPFVTSWIERAEHWYSPSNGSSDLWLPYPNICGFLMNGIYPTNQNAFHGQAQSGFIMYSGAAREYIAGKLSKPLEAGVKYCVSFRTLRRNAFRGATDSFGAYFDDDSIHDPIHTNLLYIPQVESPPGILITDTIQWTLVSGSFIANGGERFIAIGNFRDTTNTTYQVIGTGNTIWAYYFVDSVSVRTCDPTVGIDELLQPELLLIVSNDILSFHLTELIGSYRIAITDMTGRIVFRQSEMTDENPVISLNGFSNGVYIINITAEKEATISEKFFYHTR